MVHVRFASGDKLLFAALLHPMHLGERNAGEFAVLVRELFRRQEIEDRDAFVHRVFFFPGARLHLIEAGADDDLHVLPAQTPRSAAAIHGGVAPAQHDHALANFIHMLERNARQPIDADMDVGGGFLLTRQIEIASARSAGADKHRVPLLRQQRFQALHPLAEMRHRLVAQDIIHLFVDHALRQAEAWDLGADHAAALGVGVEDVDLVAQRQEIARHCQRSRPSANASHALAILLLGLGGQEVLDLALIVRRHPLQPADRHRLRLAFRILDARAPARRLARPVAGAPEDAREHVRLPIDHVGVGVTLRRDQADVFRHRRVRRTRPLAVDHLVEIVRILDVGGLQAGRSCAAGRQPSSRRARSKRRPRSAGILPASGVSTCPGLRAYRQRMPAGSRRFAMAFKFPKQALSIQTEGERLSPKPNTRPTMSASLLLAEKVAG